MAPREIEELLKNNDPPSENILQELDEMLSLPLNDLGVLDKEISNLERHLQDLKSKRKQVQERVTRYSTILSPIRRIPPDILLEIFYHCLPSGRNSIMDATDCPVLLTHICSTWRRLALSSPRLWARLHVPLLDVDDIPDDTESDASHILYEVRQLEIRVLKSRCAVVEKWLSRSGMCPLSISIYCKKYDTTVSSENVAYELLRTLAAYSARWQELEITVPFGVFLKLDKVLVAEELTMLISLAVSFQTSGSYGRMTSHQPTILKAPHLKSVSMVDKHQDLWRLPKIIVMWSKITSFCCRVPVTPRNMVILLQNCPNLVHLQIQISTHYNRSAGRVDGGVGDDQQSISLPQLRTLILIEQTDHMCLRNLYRCIEAPRLREITYASLNGHHPLALDILQKSTNLEKLTIDPTNFSDDDIRISFRSVPGLLHLEVDAILHRAKLLENKNPTFYHPWQAAVLGVLTAGCGDPMENGADITCLLPQLESLRIHSLCTVNETSDEILQDFILSRIDPRSSAALATLKHVSIAFQRPKQKEIVDVIHRRAERIGVNFKLELKYLPQGEDVNERELRKKRLSLSPGSGVGVRGEI